MPKKKLNWKIENARSHVFNDFYFKKVFHQSFWFFEIKVYGSVQYINVT